MSQTATLQPERSTPLKPWQARGAAFCVGVLMLFSLSLTGELRGVQSNATGVPLLLNGVMLALAANLLGHGVWALGTTVLVAFTSVRRTIQQMRDYDLPWTWKAFWASVWREFLQQIHGERRPELGVREWRQHLRRLRWLQRARTLLNCVGLSGIMTTLAYVKANNLMGGNTAVLSAIACFWMTHSLVAGTMGARIDKVRRFQVRTSLGLVFVAVCSIVVTAWPSVPAGSSPVWPLGAVMLAGLSSATVAYTIGRLVARRNDASPLEKRVTLTVLITGSTLGIADAVLTIWIGSSIWPIVAVIISSGFSGARNWPSREKTKHGTPVEDGDPIKVSELGSAFGYSWRCTGVFGGALLLIHFVAGLFSVSAPIPAFGSYGPLGGSWWALPALVGVIGLIQHQASQSISNAPNGNTLVGVSQGIGAVVIFILAAAAGHPPTAFEDAGTAMFAAVVVGLAMLDAFEKRKEAQAQLAST